MKRYLILFLLLAGTTVSFSADNPNQERDSIIMAINAIENDSVRLTYAVLQSNKYIRTPFARVLVDKLFEEALKLNDKNRVMIALRGYFTIAMGSLEVKEMENALKRIEEYAYRYNLYSIFFRCKESYLSLLASNGNMEFVIDEAIKMRKEAQRLNHRAGIVSAQLTLANGYYFTKNHLMVIETLQDLIELNVMNDDEKITIYLKLYNSFEKVNQPEKELEYLRLAKNLQKEVINKTPSPIKPALKDRLMHIEILFADTYMRMGEYNKAKKHLKEADKSYEPTCFISYFVLYHATHASYYARNRQWDLCFAAINRAIERLADEQPLLKNTIIGQKGDFLEQAGRVGEALEIHRNLLVTVDSLNQAFLQKQEEALAENYRWESGLVKQAKNTYLLSLIGVIFISLLLIILSIFIVRLVWVHLMLQKAEKEMTKAKDAATESDRLKEVLLKNISKEIEEPLAQINQVSNQIASASSLPDKALIQSVQKKASDLITLLELVVKYSKLEAGVMEFNVRQVEIINICHLAIKLAQEQSHHKMEVSFKSEIVSQLVWIDYDWMLSCLITTMANTDGDGLSHGINFNVKYGDEAQKVVIEIIGSPLSHTSHNSQIQTLQNYINNLFVKAFDGVYEIRASNLRPILTISLPHKEQ